MWLLISPDNYGVFCAKRISPEEALGEYRKMTRDTKIQLPERSGTVLYGDDAYTPTQLIYLKDENVPQS